ncbi:SapC family protein [Ectothiorhodospira variabilis]|uniref:SapC family protein n=1 Tax=Ectothiorhodospira variabilis TaxID=505694 RepID=UPI001EFAD4AE|nr:SapC family protein [Ectothiorhodospira variabilis]MCG5495688.1 SapC family protein [Ectothiorhodospira variabilis]MCG5504584.1 SapC family protein [Ectothiorhodospira variabilis]MCG5507708.1 SapC family protein [Ectothiorhodospira variabilis]
MAEYQPLNPADHGDGYWHPTTGYRFALDQCAVTLVGGELSAASRHMPVGLARHQGQWSLVAVMSREPGRNVLVDGSGRWRVGYVPSILRGHPFALVAVPGKDRHVLCVEKGSVTADTSGEAFFTSEGELSPRVSRVLKFLTEREKQQIKTQRALKVLDEADILIPWPILKGVYRVDEKKLNALEDGAFLRLRESGVLPLLYAHLVSVGHEGLLDVEAGEASIPDKLDDLFGGSGDDLTFDFH